MFEQVIIGIDADERREDAIRLARELVAPGGTLTLAHVHVQAPVYGKGMLSVVEEDAHRRAEAVLAEASAATGITSTVALGARSVGRGLHELAERTGADLVVIGSTRHGLVGRVLVADHTREAINGAPCAVAIAPAAYAQTPPVLREVGVAYNETPESAHALAVAREVAAAHEARVSVFEVVPLPMYLYYGYGAPYGDIADETLDAVRAELDKLEGVQAHVVFGDPAEELTVYSASLDLLVVGSRGFGPIGRLIHSSTSSRLAHSSRCPLLILPREVHPVPATEAATAFSTTTA